jgi:uncharacterized protein
MAKRASSFSSGYSGLAVPTRFAVVALFSVLIGGAMEACSRRATDSDEQRELLAALRKWEISVQAKRAAVPESPRSLEEALQVGDSKSVEALLAQGADQRTLNEALFIAARSEPLAIGPHGENAQGEVDRLYFAIARLLLRKGANIEARDQDGNTPLISAAGNGETAVVKLLLENGADAEATDSAGRTALISAACDCPIVDMPETVDSVRLLLEKAAHLEAKDRKGGTALMAAAAWGRVSILKILLDHGANVEARDDSGNTALLISARGSAYPTAEAVEVLLSRGADVEAKNDDGETALILAASSGAFEDAKIVTMLLERGADTGVQDRRGQTALERATRTRRSVIVTLLKKVTANSH